MGVKLGWQELKYFNSCIGPALSEVTTADVIGIDPYIKYTGISFSYRELKADKESAIMICVPDSGQIKYRDQIPDYVIFFEDLYFLKDFMEERTGIGRGSSEKYTLEAGLEYLLWDNKKQKIATYGKLSQSMSLFNFPSKENYMQIIESYALSIIEKSPLVRRYTCF